jgi:hypothetical protein
VRIKTSWSWARAIATVRKSLGLLDPGARSAGRKHNWLFLNHLDTLATVERLVVFYVQQHNAVIPHSAFHGQTPDEMYFGTGTTIPEHLTVARRLARDARLDKNRSLHCRACPPDFSPPISPPDPASPVISSLLQLHAPNSRMS